MNRILYCDCLLLIRIMMFLMHHGVTNGHVHDLEWTERNLQGYDKDNVWSKREMPDDVNEVRLLGTKGPKELIGIVVADIVDRIDPDVGQPEVVEERGVKFSTKGWRRKRDALQKRTENMDDLMQTLRMYVRNRSAQIDGDGKRNGPSSRDDDIRLRTQGW